MMSSTKLKFHGYVQQIWLGFNYRSRSSCSRIRCRADSCTMDTPKQLQVSSAQPEICILSPRRQGHVWANKYTQLGDRQQTQRQRSEDLRERSEGFFEDSLCCWVTGSDHVCASVLVVHRSSLALTGSLRDQGEHVIRCSLWGVRDGPVQAKAYVRVTPLTVKCNTNM